MTEQAFKADRAVATPPNVKIAFLRARMLRSADALDGFAGALDRKGLTVVAALARTEARSLRRDAEAN